MSYTNVAGKRIRQKFGAFRAMAFVDFTVGMSAGLDASNDGMILGDEADGVTCVAVACENIAAGEEGWFALGVEIEAPDTESAGLWTKGVLGAAGDVGSILYLDENGLFSTSAGGTTVQPVGFITATNRMVIVPSGYLSSTSQTLSGSLTIGTTLGVTGNTTLTGTLTCNGHVTLGSGENLTLTKGDLTLTEGDAVLTKGDLTLTAGDETLTDGSITLTTGVIKMVQKTAKTATATLTDAEQGYVEVSPIASTTLTLPTAAAGKYFLIKHLATTQTLIVAAGASHKLIDPSDGGVHDKATDDKGLDCILELRAVDAVNWLVIHSDGDWTFAD